MSGIKSPRVYNNNQREIPQYLYRFYKLNDYNVEDLENNRIYLANPEYFNDPFDGTVFLKGNILFHLIENKYKRTPIGMDISVSRLLYETDYKTELDIEKEIELLLVEKIGKESTEKIFAEYKKKIEIVDKKNYRVACFSGFMKESEFLKRSDMWAYYTNNHQGYCVRYSMESVKDIISQNMYKVDYNDNVKKIPKKDLHEFLLSSLLRKSKVWQHEMEYRLILPKELTNSDKIGFKYADTIYLGVNSLLNKDLKTLTERVESISAENNIRLKYLKLSRSKRTFELKE